MLKKLPNCTEMLQNRKFRYKYLYYYEELINHDNGETIIQTYRLL